MPRNVLGTELEVCSKDPVTGFFRDGFCKTAAQDYGMHTVCAIMTKEFLAFTKEAGNDLSTPRPEYDFPGLKPGDRWCVCLGRWVEAMEAGVVAPLVLEGTHVSVLEFVDRTVLRMHAREDGGTF